MWDVPTYIRFYDSCPVRKRTAYYIENATAYVILLLFLLGVVTVFGSEPLVNIIGGVPTERPCVHSYICTCIYCILVAVRAMIEVVFR